MFFLGPAARSVFPSRICAPSCACTWLWYARASCGAVTRKCSGERRTDGMREEKVCPCVRVFAHGPGVKDLQLFFFKSTGQ